MSALDELADYTALRDAQDAELEARKGLRLARMRLTRAENRYLDRWFASLPIVEAAALPITEEQS